jgi:hypothetical protein
MLKTTLRTKKYKLEEVIKKEPCDSLNDACHIGRIRFKWKENIFN